MERRRPPETEEGWYVLHDFRAIDWDAWRGAPDRRRRRAIREGVGYVDAAERREDAEAGGSATFAILGHEADLLVLHLRPSTADLDVLERRFERTELAAFTDRVDSYVSVTEVSGYMSEAYFEEGEEADPGIARYIASRLHPEIPDAEHVCFYPMDKRRGPEDNWYDLSFDERAEHLAAHGEIGREYAGRVTQIISGSVGLDDHEWGVTLFADDPVDIKDLLYEMRFDPSSSRFAEFGRFRFGRRLPPEQLAAYLAGEPVGADVEVGGDERPDASTHHEGEAHHYGGESGGYPHADAAGGHHGEAGDGHPHSDAGDGHPHGDDGSEAESSDDGQGGPSVRDELDDLGVYAGSPHGEDVHAIVLYSTADSDDLFEEVDGLRKNFDHYDSHVKTAVYEATEVSAGSNETAVVSLWETERAAETAAGFLAELPEVVRQAGDRAPAGADDERGDGPASDGDDSWGTMGMFYAIKPEHRTDFIETFAEVGDVLGEMEGHRRTDLLANREDENDTFIASRWDSRENAMAFFRSDAFADTVEWGRDVLADRPRHVFLA